MLKQIQSFFSTILILLVAWFFYGLYMRNSGFENRNTYERQKAKLRELSLEDTFEKIKEITGHRDEVKKLCRELKRELQKSRWKNRKRPVLRRR